ncbi:hypothetical protein [Saccharopolyspora taberi]|uniref:LPXTG cell wall anchor domain-containing protein n=1 Tax=Saccharopolyspora taberi TaxID=60895 RepID=A0ABN3V7G1_9PSEU
MRRTGHALAVLLIGWLLVFAPPALAEPAPAPAATVAVTQAPPAAPEQQPQPPDRQRLAIGVTGLVLIAVVLFSRKLRNKPVLFFTFKKKS